MLLALVVGGMFVLAFYLHLKSVQAEFEKYQQAEICQDRPDCRQMLEAKVVNSQTVTNFVSLVGKYRTSKITNSRYFVDLKSAAADTANVELMPLVFADLSEIEPDAGKSVTPETLYWQENHFTEKAFPVGSSIKIEMWNGKIMTLFSTRIDYENLNGPSIVRVLSPSPLTDNAEAQVTFEASDELVYAEVAVPTLDNPLGRYQSARQNYTNSIFVVSCALLFVFGFRIFLFA